MHEEARTEWRLRIPKRHGSQPGGSLCYEGLRKRLDDLKVGAALGLNRNGQSKAWRCHKSTGMVSCGPGYGEDWELKIFNRVAAAVWSAGTPALPGIRLGVFIWSSKGFRRAHALESALERTKVL